MNIKGKNIKGRYLLSHEKNRDQQYGTYSKKLLTGTGFTDFYLTAILF